MPLSRSDQARVNGAESRGPKTPDGKARSSLNAFKHGRYATNAIVLSNEDADALEELVAYHVCRIQPTDPVEYSLTRELASIDWRLTRVFALDTRMLDREMDIQRPALVTAGHSLSELTRLLDASRSIADRSKLPAYLARREAQLINARRSILAVLKDLRKNFPSSDPAPEVVLPQPLDPESPQENEPETNPTESGADPQVCAGPPGPAPEQTSPQPANVQSIDSGVESGEHASNLTLDKFLPGTASDEAALDTNSASIQPTAAPVGSAPVDLSAGRPAGLPPRPETPGESAPPLPKAA